MRGLVAVVLFVAIGCGGSSSNTGGDGGPACTPATKECVNDEIARVCASDGTWVPQACQNGSLCMDGMCVAQQDVACKPADSTCLDQTHALICNTNGVGYTSVSCPANTVCQGLGLCVGTCVVGSSRCSTTNVVATCTDGFTYTDSACMPGVTSCVTTSASGAALATAACKPIGCTSGASVCGDKATDPSSTDPNYTSSCVTSPAGLRWQSEQCAVPGSCVPGAGCSPTCIPDSVRCASGNAGIQTCGTDGKWGVAAACTTNASGAAQVCISSSGSAVCGDPVCAFSTGACEMDGFHPCLNGKVSATAQACQIGVCVATSTTPIGGYTPGSCQAQCAAGDSKCDGLISYQTCDNGRWSSTTTACANDRCVQYTDPATNGARTVCGVCAPGTRRCTDSGGVAGGVTDIETCNATGQWGANSACTVGQCTPSGSTASCIAQCVPGSTVCVGTAKATPPDPLHPGTIAEVTCSQTGTLGTIPTATDCASATPPTACCAANTSCRKGPNGQPVGTGAAACVQCVGPNIAGGNELGLVDSYCTDTTHLEVCTATNTWPAATTACTNSCQQEGLGGTCLTCFSTAPTVCSNSAFMSHGFGTCTISACGATSDCCSGYCSLSGPPAPAVCQ